MSGLSVMVQAQAMAELTSTWVQKTSSALAGDGGFGKESLPTDVEAGRRVQTCCMWHPRLPRL